MSRIWLFTAIIILSLSCSVSKKTDRGAGVRLPDSIKGNFTDDYAITYSINEKIWMQHPGTKYNILKYDSAGQYIIAKNDINNPGDGGLFTRIDIIQFTSMEPWHWGFCLSAYNAKTFEEAEACIKADRANPKTGCAGFPFSRMKRN